LPNIDKKSALQTVSALLKALLSDHMITAKTPNSHLVFHKINARFYGKNRFF